MKYLIPTYRLSLLNEKLEKLNRKAAKLGLAPVKTRVLGFIKGMKKADGGLLPDRTEIEVTGAYPNLPGYTFMGTIEHTKAGNILRAVPDQSIPEEYRNIPASCQHCKKTRARKDSYVVRHESGQVLQIGRTCIKDFLGGCSPEQIARLLEVIAEMERAMDHEGFSRAKWDISMLDVLACAAATIRDRGFVSKAAAQAYAEKGGQQLKTSAGLVSLNLQKPSKELHEYFEKFPKDRIHEQPCDLEKAEQVIAWVKTMNAKNDYLLNLKAAVLGFERIEVPGRHLGLVVAAVAAYDKEMGFETKRRERMDQWKERLAGSQHFGEVGKRYDLQLTLTKRLVIGRSEYGRHGQDRYLMIFEDASGSQFIWFTAKDGEQVAEPIKLADGSDYVSHRFIAYEEGKTYAIRSTVKAHNERNGIKQTMLTRCSVSIQKEGEKV